jgi:hypothetical protein
MNDRGLRKKLAPVLDDELECSVSSGHDDIGFPMAVLLAEVSHYGAAILLAAELRIIQKLCPHIDRLARGGDHFVQPTIPVDVRRQEGKPINALVVTGRIRTSRGQRQSEPP